MVGDLLAFLLLFFLVLIALRVPVSHFMLLTSLMYILLSHRMSMSFIPQGMVSGLAGYSVMCFPLSIVVDCVMNKTGVADKIFGFADYLIGHIRGGLRYMNVAVNPIFADMSGSASTDAAGLRNIEIEAMTGKGFGRGSAAGITVVPSVTGSIFPPSNPMVYVGITTGVSIGTLLPGGIVVGVLMILFMCITVYAATHRRNYLVRKRVTVREVCHMLREGFWALMAPVTLIFCIQNGNIVPIEAGAVAFVYALFISMSIYKTIKFRDLYSIMVQAVNSIGLVPMLASSGKVFAWALGDQQVAEIVSKGLFSLITDPWPILLLINLFLLFLGTLMEPVAAVTITAPILSPIALSIGLNPMQFGVIFMLNLMIEVLTPPMTVVLFVTSKIGEISSRRAFKAALPYYVALLLVLALVDLSPALTLGLPDLMLGGYK